MYKVASKNAYHPYKFGNPPPKRRITADGKEECRKCNKFYNADEFKSYECGCHECYEQEILTEEVKNEIRNSVRAGQLCEALSEKYEIRLSTVNKITKNTRRKMRRQQRETK